MNNSESQNFPANVAQLVAQIAARQSEKIAIVAQRRGRTRQIKFGALWRDAAALGVNLRQLGLQPGDRVIVMIPMSIELYVTLLAVVQIGAVAVFVDPWIGARQIARFADFAEPRAFIGIGKSHLLRLLHRRLRGIGVSITTGQRWFGRLPARYRLCELLQSESRGEVEAVSPDASALITFTSGSSGEPKGANRTHQFLRAQHLALKHEFPYRDGDVDMPMFPVFALNNLVTGITSVFPEMDFRKVAEVDARGIASQMERWGVTTCTASPPLLDRLSEFVLNTNSGATSLSLRRVLTGGAPVSNRQLKTWVRAFPDTELVIAYGSTEAEPVSHIHARDRLGLDETTLGYCTGVPTAMIQTRLIPICREPVVLERQSVTELALPRGEIGELVVCGEHVCRDYFCNERATAENKLKDPDGKIWHCMGDTGYFDESNRFWLTGRVHSTILRDGRMVHPQLVEQVVLRTSDSIRQVAALGVPDSRLGQSVWIVVSGGQLDTELKSVIEQQLQAAGMACDRVVMTDRHLPVDPRHNSKIDYERTRSMFVPK